MYYTDLSCIDFSKSDIPDVCSIKVFVILRKKYKKKRFFLYNTVPSCGF